MKKEKHIIQLIAFALLAIGGIIGFDFYKTYSLTKEGEVNTEGVFFLIGEIAPDERISSTKKINANIEAYKVLLNAYDKIKSIGTYDYKVTEDIEGNYIIKPTIFDFYKGRERAGNEE